MMWAGSLGPALARDVPISYSRLFPFKEVKTGDLQQLIIASPAPEVAQGIARYLSQKRGSRIKIGDAQFTLLGHQTFSITLQKNRLILRNATPLIVRLSPKCINQFQIQESSKGPVFWEEGMPAEALTFALTESLLSRYNRWNGTKFKVEMLFAEATLFRSLPAKPSGQKKSGTAPSSLWEFRWSKMNQAQRKVLAFGIEAGFGERTGSGYGFMNVIRKEETHASTARGPGSDHLPGTEHPEE
jgi:CRISPR-associated endoribonuclease Cas6